MCLLPDKDRKEKKNVLNFFVHVFQRYDNRPDLPEDIAEFLGCVVDGVRPWEAGTSKVLWFFNFLTRCVKGTKFDFPSSEEECPVSLRNLLIRCWDGDLTKRPSFESVITALDYVLVDTACPLSLTGRSFWKRNFVDNRVKVTIFYVFIYTFCFFFF